MNINQWIYHWFFRLVFAVQYWSGTCCPVLVNKMEMETDEIQTDNQVKLVAV